MLLFLVLDLAVSWLLLLVPDTPLFGKYLQFLNSPRNNFLAIVAITFLLTVLGFIYTHLKFDFRVPGYDFWQKLRTIHPTELYQKFYDYTLNPNIPYAKHAISIDENRKDFQRVPWYRDEIVLGTRDERGNIFFEQVWFPGNHADIGGGYEENESRLSDGTLHWMPHAATAIPHPIKFDCDVLVTHPAPDGKRHDEVKSGFGIVTALTGITWAEKRRTLPSNDAPVHKSVYERFDLPEAFEYDTR